MGRQDRWYKGLDYTDRESYRSTSHISTTSVGKVRILSCIFQTHEGCLRTRPLLDSVLGLAN